MMKSSVVIVGAGISGDAIAYNLALRGMKDVVVVDSFSRDATVEIAGRAVDAAKLGSPIAVDPGTVNVVVKSIDVFWLTVVTLPPNGH